MKQFRDSNTQMLKFAEEKLCESSGYRFIAGIDEVGRGCLAGPVVSSAVIIPFHKRIAWFRKVRDSKLLTSAQREYLFPCIHEAALSIGTGVVYPDVIDNRGMTKAVHLSMKLAVEKLLPQPDFALIDYLSIPNFIVPHKGVADGDSLCFSIACASIVAKVFRDHLMVELDRRFPGYEFAKNKGYATEDHISHLHKLGPSPIHRLLFKPVRNWGQLSFDDLVGDEVDINKHES